MKKNEALSILKQELDSELIDYLEAKWEVDGTFEVWEQELFLRKLISLYNLCKGTTDSSDKPLDFTKSLELSHIKEFYLLKSIKDILNWQEYKINKEIRYKPSIFKYPSYYERWKPLFDRFESLRDELFGSYSNLIEELNYTSGFTIDGLQFNHPFEYSSFNCRFNISYIKDYLNETDDPSIRLRYLSEIKSDYISSNNITDEQKKEDEFLIKLNSEINRNKELLELELKTPPYPIQTSSKYYLNDSVLPKIDFIRIFYAILKLGGIKEKDRMEIHEANFMKSIGAFFNTIMNDYSQNISTALDPKRQDLLSNINIFDKMKDQISKKYNKRLK